MCLFGVELNPENIFQNNRKCDYCFRYLIGRYCFNIGKDILDNTIVTQEGILSSICIDCEKNVFISNEKCTDCKRYIIEERHHQWSKIIHDDGYMTDKGISTTICEECENDRKKEEIFRGDQCKVCERYFLKDEQKGWCLIEIFNGFGYMNFVAANVGKIPGICKGCEEYLSPSEYRRYKYEARVKRSKKNE